MARTATKRKETLSATLIKHNASSIPEPQLSSPALDLEKNSSDASLMVQAEKKTNKSPKKNATDATKGSSQTKLDLQKKIEQLEKIIIELTQKQILPAASPAPLPSQTTEKISNEIKKIKVDLVDVSSNVFHLQKIAKDTNIVMENRINQLFIKLTLIIILSTLAITFLLLWLLTN